MAAAGEHRLTDLARRVISSGGRVHSYQIHDPDEIQGINTPGELAVAEDIVLKRLFVPKKNTDTKIVFGTGGWRAVIGEGYTLANVRRLCQAIANETIRRELDSQPIVIGGDRRFLSRDSAIAAAEVFAGNNIPVVLLPDDVPTPLVTFAAPHLGAAYGVIITSSHNPPEWNGMKVFRADGSLPLDEETDRFQDEANAMTVDDVITLDIDLARSSGMVVERALTTPYVDAIEAIIDVDAARDADLNVIVDPMYGTSQLTLGMILNDMRVRTEFIHAAHNPLFGGIAPAPDLERLSALIGMITHGNGRYDLGLATDGDSDRIGDRRRAGASTSPPTTCCCSCTGTCTRSAARRGGVVRNLATTHLLDRLAAHFGEESRECRVGLQVRHCRHGRDRCRARRRVLRRPDDPRAGSRARTASSRAPSSSRCWPGRASGSASCARWCTGSPGGSTRKDESVAATPEMRVAVPRRLEAEPLTHIGPYPVIGVSHLDGTKILLDNDNWALLRFSGTEPALRLFVEADSPEKAEELLAWLRGFVTAG